MKSVTQVTDHWFPDKIGGSCKYAFALAHLLGAHCDMTTLTLRAAPDPAESGLHLRKILGKTAILANTLRIWRFLRQNPQDCLLVHSPLAYCYAALPARLTRTPLVAIFHGPWGTEAAHKYRNAGGMRAGVLARLTPVLTWVERRWLRASGAVIFLSAYMRDRALALHGAQDNAHILPFWTGGGIASLPSRDRLPPYHLLVLRRLEYRMGIQDLLAVLAQAPAGTRLTIVGSGTYEPALRNQVAALGLQDRVTFAGRVDEAEKLRLMRAADFMILPSVDLEGFGIVVLEALESGLPVICRSGVGFLDFHTPAMGGAIFRYDSDAELLALLGAGQRVAIAPKAFAAFHPDAIADRIMAIIAGLGR